MVRKSLAIILLLLISLSLAQDADYEYGDDSVPETTPSDSELDALPLTTSVITNTPPLLSDIHQTFHPTTPPAEHHNTNNKVESGTLDLLHNPLSNSSGVIVSTSNMGSHLRHNKFVVTATGAFLAMCIVVLGFGLLINTV
jgi:hypothetical protein